MWYWYFLGGVGFFIGLFSYSSLVVAGRADERRDAMEREERSRSHLSASAPEMEPGFNDKSEERVLAVTSILRPRARPPLHF